MLAGSRGCDTRDDAEEAPMSRITDLSAAVVVFRPALPRARLRQVPRPVPLAAPQGVALPQVPEPSAPRPEEVM